MCDGLVPYNVLFILLLVVNNIARHTRHRRNFDTYLCREHKMSERILAYPVHVASYRAKYYPGRYLLFLHHMPFILYGIKVLPHLPSTHHRPSILPCCYLICVFSGVLHFLSENEQDESVNNKTGHA